MPSAVWTVLATDGVRSLVEVREDGLVWIRPDLTRDEACQALTQVVQRLPLVTKVSHASH